MPEQSIAAQVSAIRAFNRFYTRKIGVINGTASSPFSLAEARVLYELAHREQRVFHYHDRRLIPEDHRVAGASREPFFKFVDQRVRPGLGLDSRLGGGSRGLRGGSGRSSRFQRSGRLRSFSRRLRGRAAGSSFRFRGCFR